MIPKFTAWVNRNQRDLVVLACLALVAVTTFNLGRLSVRQRLPVTVSAGSQAPSDADGPVPAGRATNSDQRVVVSKSSSSGKYHHAWCSGASRIKPENQVWFDTATLAEAAGYSLAGNCQ